MGRSLAPLQALGGRSFSGFSFVCIRGLSRRRLGEGGSIRGSVRRAFDINTNSGYGPGCSSGHGNFQWVFLKVWLSRLISGF
jgi:hypothetical protein